MDARQQRTRERLHTAVLVLAAEHAPDELSMTEVAEAAGVHRSTLYEHASSPAALLERALLAELDALRDGLLADLASGEQGGSGDVVAAVTAVTEGVLRHVAAHAAIYRRGLGETSGTASLHAMLGGHFRESGRLLQAMACVEVDLPVSGVDDALVADLAGRFIAEGTVGVIEGWLQAPAPDVADFMRVYQRLLPAWWPRDLSATVES